MDKKQSFIVFGFLTIVLVVGLFLIFQERQKSQLENIKEDSGSEISIVGTKDGQVSDNVSEIINSVQQEQALNESGKNNQQTDSNSVDQNGPKTQEIMDKNKKQFNGVQMVVETGKKYSAVLQTSAGDITIELDTKQTPITANNFVFLAKEDFYDKTIFHRVIDGFMIQGGDPDGNGTGGPGYKFDDEAFDGEYTRGTVAMANSGPNTNGSQFFIMHEDTGLPKNYVIFGKVTDGMDVVDEIATSPVERGMSGESSKPLNPVVIENVKIIEE